MEIEYQIKRMDFLKGYFYGLRKSPRTRLIVFGLAFILFAYQLFIRYHSQGRLTLDDFFVATLFAIGVILAIPAIGLIFARDRKRTLSINAEGLGTKIGTRAGTVPWKAVDSIAAVDNGILFTGKNANSFTIPASAFPDPQHCQQFLDLARQYLANAQ